MSLKTFVAASALFIASFPAFAGEAKIMIEDAYARSGAKSGAAFFKIINNSDVADRLVAARSEGIKRVELHTHKEDAKGVMKMREIEGGIEVPAGGTHALARGGDHVMFMGLETPFEQGSTVSVVLTFENAGEVTLEVPVDNDRKAAHGDHSGHKSN